MQWPGDLLSQHRAVLGVAHGTRAPLGLQNQSSWISTMLNSNSAAALFITNSQDHCFSQSMEISWDVSGTLRLEESLCHRPTLLQWTHIIICSWPVERAEFKKRLLCQISNSWHCKIPERVTNPHSNKFYPPNLLTNKFLTMLSAAGCWKGTSSKRPRLKVYWYLKTQDTCPSIFFRHQCKLSQLLGSYIEVFCLGECLWRGRKACSN